MSLSFRELLYFAVGGTKFFFPKPLYQPSESLPNLINDKGEVKQLPSTNTPDVKGFVHILTEQEKRAKLYSTMTFKNRIVDERGNVLVSNVDDAVGRKVRTMFANREIYQKVSGSFSNPIRWFHVGLIAELECSQNLNCYLGNGQPFNRRTTIVPKGRGPFKSFVEGAKDAIKLEKLDKVQDWSIGNTLYMLEVFNGTGYSKYRGINSPYIWSGSNHYSAGKYVADGVYSKTAVSGQIGVALMLKEILSKLSFEK